MKLSQDNTRFLKALHGLLSLLIEHFGNETRPQFDITPRDNRSPWKSPADTKSSAEGNNEPSLN